MGEEKRPCIALAGNPNTGKSTLFNALTGLKQHTGNWSGKTVGRAEGRFWLGKKEAVLVDLPGIYSLFSAGAEEACARDFLAFGGADAVAVVVDASCLERHLPLALQVMELMPRCVLCLNLSDEAEKKGIHIDEKKLSALTGVPVVKTAARTGRGLSDLTAALEQVMEQEPHVRHTPFHKALPAAFEELLAEGEDLLPESRNRPLLLDFLWQKEEDVLPDAELRNWQSRCRAYFAGEEEVFALYRKERSLCFQKRAETLASAVCKKDEIQADTTAQMDKLFLRKRTGVPVMLLLLALVFWITAVGANAPSQWLMSAFTQLGTECRSVLVSSPVWLESLLMDGVFLTVSWVVSVMLPPMAIFFPMFTLLEDCGLLPRIAFQLDGLFRRAGAHGKQALTLCMGFGCNAAGVTACRIIDSPRERLIAILTNNFVPCNGRFPTILLLTAVFLSGGKAWMSGFTLFVVIGISVGMTLLVSFFLSRTLLRGMPSAFVLELPPFRRPQIGQVLVRSLLDRTIFVLGRAITAAAPAGAVIWLLQRIPVGDGTLLTQIAMFLEPLGGLMGLSGPILLAFLLGLPANEIVLPILLMFYSQSGMLMEGGSQTGAMLMANGWTWTTAVCAILFSLNHFPCATTLLTIRKETDSWRWTAVSFLLPTVIGICLCAAVHGIFCLFGLT
ncbi:ferrous iron transport protein B [Anaerotignum sp.]|uniref:ferrous iron transport protein B n=1 Tax=Anaerotignum sp. TaxID=2039241 RepID=UPI002A91D8C3|nr:ferrous iron transport protein B [Anaerotignum sp.]MCI7657943.1 ferrous iron transport protein B [Clostridia bacterium]MDY5415876.1 ferrous iron transport protein B [Anaerotignum sp.]